MEKKINIILNECLGNIDSIDEVTELKAFEDWDSMSHMVLITRIEADFNIAFTGDEIANLRTVHKLYELIHLKSQVAS